jgi:hypothetical protein
MVNTEVQAWLAKTGEKMIQAANSDSPFAMYYIMTIVAGQADRYVTPARIAREMTEKLELQEAD